MLQSVCKPHRLVIFLARPRHYGKAAGQRTHNAIFERAKKVYKEYALVKRVKEIVSSGDEDLAWYYIRAHPPKVATVEAYNAYLTVCARRGNVAVVESAYNKMKKSQLVPTERTFSALLQSLVMQAKLKDLTPHKTRLVLQRLIKYGKEMARYNVQWNCVHMNLVLGLFRYLGFHADAFKTYFAAFESSVEDVDALLLKHVVPLASADETKLESYMGGESDVLIEKATPGLDDMAEVWERKEIEEFCQYMQLNCSEFDYPQIFDSAPWLQFKCGTKLKPSLYTFSEMFGICGALGGMSGYELLRVLLRDLSKLDFQMDSFLMTAILRVFENTGDRKVAWKATRLLSFFFRLQAPLPTLDMDLKADAQVHHREQPFSQTPSKPDIRLLFVLLRYCKTYFPQFGEHYYSEFCKQSTQSLARVESDPALQIVRAECLHLANKHADLFAIWEDLVYKTKSALRIYAYSKKPDTLSRDAHKQLLQKLMQKADAIVRISKIVELSCKLQVKDSGDQSQKSRQVWQERLCLVGKEVMALEFLSSRTERCYNEKYKLQLPGPKQRTA